MKIYAKTQLCALSGLPTEPVTRTGDGLVTAAVELDDVLDDAALLVIVEALIVAEDQP